MNQSNPAVLKYSYQDYLKWSDDEKWEIIGGDVYNMTPAPGIKHQGIVSNLHIKLKLNPGNLCYTGIAPTDVVLDEYNIVQPDVFVVCDKTKITEANIKGTPDLVIEVTSPSTRLKDKREKKDLYEKFGVKEYIVVYPEDELVERFLLDDKKYGAPEIHNWDETMKINILGFEIHLWEIFEKEPDKKEDRPRPKTG